MGGKSTRGGIIKHNAMYYGAKFIGRGSIQQLLTFGNGRLYNWYAVNTGRLAPDGWRVPTYAEFTTLQTFLGGSSVAGGPLKSTRTGLTPGWNAPNTGATNSSGFNALGSGRRNESGIFQLTNRVTQFGTNTIITDSWACLSIQSSTASAGNGTVNKLFGLSIRCILDNPANWSPGMMVTDIDGNIYPTVKIGNQVWMASNLKTTRLNDGTEIPNVTVNAEWAALTTPGQCTYNNAAIAEFQQLWPII